MNENTFTKEYNLQIIWQNKKYKSKISEGNKMKQYKQM